MSQNSLPQEKRAPHKRGMFMVLVVLVALCSNKDAQPIVNSGSIY